MILMRTSRWADRIGWFLEKGLIWIVCSLFVLIFLGNKLLILFNMSYGLYSLENFLYHSYDLIIEPNIGTITTIASIYVGIYITVLSVLGSIKANSVMALLSDNLLKKIIKYVITGLIASFVVVFYSFFAILITNEFIKSFFFFLFVFYMLLTSLRLGINLSVIYSVDLHKISENIEKEKDEAEKYKHVMSRLEKYLDDREAERFRQR